VADKTFFYIVFYCDCRHAVLHLFCSDGKNKKEITYVVPKQVIQTYAVLPSTPSGGIIKQVYANELPVKMQQVFLIL